MATATTRRTTTRKKATEAPAPEHTEDDVVDEAPAAAPKGESISQKRNRLRNEAERVVINNHREEFNEVATKLFADNGLVFHRRLTDQEKAAKEIADKLNQFPELRDMFLGVSVQHAAQQEQQEQQDGGAVMQVQPLDVNGEPDGDPYEVAYSDEDWAEQQQRVADIAAADGVSFVEEREGE